MTYPSGWFYRQGEYLYETSTDSWHFISGNPWLTTPGQAWSRWNDQPDGWYFIDREYVLINGRHYWVNPDAVYGHDMKRGGWRHWKFAERPAIRGKLVKIWSTPSSHPNIINMIGIPGENRAAIMTAKIGFHSSYGSQVWSLAADGNAVKLVETGNETIGHNSFYGPDGRSIIMPVEHGSRKPWILSGGNMREGAVQPGRWGLSGLTHDGVALVATSNDYKSGAVHDQPRLCRVDDGREVKRYPRKGLLWCMWEHNREICAINCYGDEILYRGDRTEKTDAKMGASYQGFEVLGGGIRSGTGKPDGRLWVNGREFKTPCQSIEVLYVTHKGRCFACGINPDQIYQIVSGVPVLIAEIPGDKPHTGGWSFGVGFAELDDGTVLFGRTGKNGSEVFLLEVFAEAA
jgi:hypothetical protein